MKKIALLITAVAVCGLLVSPVSGQEKCVFGPYYMTASNTQDCVPDDQEYAGVSIDTCEDTLQALSDDEVCNGDRVLSLITVAPNEEVLIPGSNYGIQRFGLNYRGDDPENLEPVVVQLNGSWTVQSGWRVRYNYDGFGASYGPFGVFTYDETATGNNRQNPLQFVLCYSGERTDITVYDFYVTNQDDYMFAAHIADFTDRSCDSAFFALPVPIVLVELADFRAIGLPGTVIVKWTTASEIDNAGFNLYRADSADGEYAQINAGLIPPKGSPTSSSTYLYFDADVERGKTYYYKLEDVDLYGEKVVNGPVSASTRIFGPGK